MLISLHDLTFFLFFASLGVDGQARDFPFDGRLNRINFSALKVEVHGDCSLGDENAPFSS